MKTLTTKELTEINRHLTIALMGANKKAKEHIEKALEILNKAKQ